MYAGRVVEEARGRGALPPPAASLHPRLLDSLPAPGRGAAGTSCADPRRAARPARAARRLRLRARAARWPATRCRREVPALEPLPRGGGAPDRLARRAARGLLREARARRRGGRGVSAPLLEVRDLRVHFPPPLGRAAGRRCAPSTASASTLERGDGAGPGGRVGLRQVDRRARSGRPRASGRIGSIRLAGQELDRTCAGRRLRRGPPARCRCIFQDPYSSLDPRQTVRQILTEPLACTASEAAASAWRRAVALLDAVGLRPGHLDRYPHEFSGGQRQRIAIARALALEPELLVWTSRPARSTCRCAPRSCSCWPSCASASGSALLFITHDLALVRHLCERVAVMYLGRLCELGPRERGLRRAAPPLHAGAARRGARARPGPGARAGRARSPLGEVPSPSAPAAGLPLPPALRRARARPGRALRARGAALCTPAGAARDARRLPPVPAGGQGVMIEVVDRHQALRDDRRRRPRLASRSARARWSASSDPTGRARPRCCACSRPTSRPTRATCASPATTRGDAPLEVRAAIGALTEHNALYEDMRVDRWLDFAGRARGLHGSALVERKPGSSSAAGSQAVLSAPHPGVLQGLPPAHRPGRGAAPRPAGAGARRADPRARSAAGGRLPRLRARAGPRPRDPVLEPHRGRGRRDLRAPAGDPPRADWWPTRRVAELRARAEAAGHTLEAEVLQRIRDAEVAP